MVAWASLTRVGAALVHLGLQCCHGAGVSPEPHHPSSSWQHRAPLSCSPRCPTLALSLLPPGAPTVSLTIFAFLSSYALLPFLPSPHGVSITPTTPSLSISPDISPCQPSLQEGRPHPLTAGGPQQLVQWPPARAQDQPPALIPQVPRLPLQ